MVAESSLIKELIESNKQTQKLLTELMEALSDFTKVVGTEKKEIDDKIAIVLEQNQKLALAMNDIIKKIQLKQRIPIPSPPSF